MTYKDFFPPVLFKMIKKFLVKKEKQLTTFEEVKNACEGRGYNSAELCQMVGDKTVVYKQSIKKPYKVHPTYLLLAGALSKFYSEYEKDKISIMDFGGSCGAVYFDIRHLLGSNIKLAWNVVDLPEMIQSAIAHNLESTELHFFDKIENIKSDIDIVHTSGTLHYVEDAYKTIEKLMNLKARYILFNRMLFNETKNDRYIIQHSGYRGVGPGKVPAGYIDKDIDFPVRIMSFQKFSSLLEIQYELEWTYNIGISISGVIEKGLLYSRK